MFGKAFLSMYEGSMVGAGPVKFAVWNYIIAKAYKSRVEVNPKLLGAILGCSEKEVQDALDWACSPDDDSRNKDYGGARLVKEGQFQYFVPSWEYYHAMRSEDDRREYNRRKKAEEREKKKLEKNGANGEIPKKTITKTKTKEPSQLANDAMTQTGLGAMDRIKEP